MRSLAEADGASGALYALDLTEVENPIGYHQGCDRITEVTIELLDYSSKVL